MEVLSESGTGRKQTARCGGSFGRRAQGEGEIRFMQMNVRNILNDASCIGIKTRPFRRRSCSFAVRVQLDFYPLLNASAKKDGTISSH